MSFREMYSFSQRRDEAFRIRLKFPHRIPVIVEKHQGCTLAQIDKTKFLVPDELSFGQLIWIVRGRLKLQHDMAMFLFVGNVMPTSGDRIINVANKYCSDDGFLYVTYIGEAVFGDAKTNERIIPANSNLSWKESA